MTFCGAFNVKKENFQRKNLASTGLEPTTFTYKSSPPPPHTHKHTLLLDCMAIALLSSLLWSCLSFRVCYCKYSIVRNLDIHVISKWLIITAMRYSEHTPVTTWPPHQLKILWEFKHLKLICFDFRDRSVLFKCQLLKMLFFWSKQKINHSFRIFVATLIAYKMFFICSKKNSRTLILFL